MKREDNNEEIETPLKLNSDTKSVEPESETLNPKKEPSYQVNDKKTCLERIKNMLSSITVEPVIFFFVIPSIISGLATTNLNLEKACRVNLNFTTEVCEALKTRNTEHLRNEELSIQQMIASIQTWKTILQASLPIILVQFLGAWSDKTGKRKFCMVLPIIGELLVCISNLMNTYFFYEIPVQITMLLEGLFPALSGGFTTLMMGVFSYISDITSTETRTFRVGLVNLCLTTGMPVGTALSGIMIKCLGYYGVFSVCGFLYFMNILYIIFVLKEPEKQLYNKKKINGLLKGFFDISNLVKTLTVAFKKREDNKRMKILMVLILFIMMYGPNHGESSVQYLYVRYRFNWDVVSYSLYATFSIIVHTMGALFSITVFSRCLKWDDSMLGIISVTSKFFGCLMKIIASNGFEYFLVPTVEILNATTFTSLRSIASKLVPAEEIGKINSLVSLVESFAAMMYDPIYSFIYGHTLKTLPVSVFIFSCTMTIPPTIILIWLFSQHRKELKKKTIFCRSDGSNISVHTM